MQTLFSLVGLMRNMSPDGSSGAANPKLILTNPDWNCASPQPNRRDPGVVGPSVRHGALTQAVSDRIGKMEEELGAQNTELDSLRAAVEQNEELMEALVDSISMMDDLTFGKGEKALGSKPLAS